MLQPNGQSPQAMDEETLRIASPCNRATRSLTDFYLARMESGLLKMLRPLPVYPKCFLLANHRDGVLRDRIERSNSLGIRLK